MSVQEIKAQIERLSSEEQSQIESFLKTKRTAEHPTFQQRVEEAHARFDAGGGVSSAELRAILAKRGSVAS